MHKRFAAGILTGCCGALVTNPLDLLKTRMQAQASGDNATVGHQHGYAGVVDGVTRMLREEGVVGMYKVLAPAATLTRTPTYRLTLARNPDPDAHLHADPGPQS
eukprot:6602359-Prymnesium_polylepis.1